VTLEVEGGPELGVDGMWTVEDLLLVRPMRAAFGIPKCMIEIIVSPEKQSAACYTNEQASNTHGYLH
jgi:hypothetical protein